MAVEGVVEVFVEDVDFVGADADDWTCLWSDIG